MMKIQKILCLTLACASLQTVHGALFRRAVGAVTPVRVFARACASGPLSLEQRKLVEQRIAWLEQELARIPRRPYDNSWSYEGVTAHVHTNRALREFGEELLKWQLRLLQK